jgi:hypothetical protein
MGTFINTFVNNHYKLLGNDILYCPLIFIGIRCSRVLYIASFDELFI